ncbi:uncharacterized protein B0H64DRAFT_125441 [Chaetomium fimeti]|uniref:Uncharacterized protein n=1 Tax=Chaetomium fimeti TaxID=1854472 RepID=A0AAE0HJC7_9PEZI|nr:hypothetical protein B0H64DRAFT_125441 [Chaetomium fimeti]
MEDLNCPWDVEMEGCPPRRWRWAMWPSDWCVSLWFLRIMGTQKGVPLVGRGLVGLYPHTSRFDQRSCWSTVNLLPSSVLLYGVIRCGSRLWYLLDCDEIHHTGHLHDRVLANRGHGGIPSPTRRRSTKSECMRTCHRNAGTASPAATPVHHFPASRLLDVRCTTVAYEYLHTYVQTRHARRRLSSSTRVRTPTQGQPRHEDAHRGALKQNATASLFPGRTARMPVTARAITVSGAWAGAGAPRGKITVPVAVFNVSAVEMLRMRPRPDQKPPCLLVSSKEV